MRFLIILIFFFSLITLKSQNLIQNGDFEEFKKQSGYFPFNHLEYWHRTTWGSTDYQTSRYRWSYNKTKAYSGDAFMCFIIYVLDRNYCEYGTNRLSAPLKKDSLYCLSMYVCLSEISNSTPKNLDINFSKNKIKRLTHKSIAKKYSADIHNIGNDYIMNTHKWQQRSAIYKARGGERFMTIGMFSEDRDFLPLFADDPKRTPYIYLYIDLVSLVPISDNSKCQCNKRTISFADTPKIVENTTDTIPFTKGDIIKLSDVHFESNSYELNDSSKQELNKLFDLLSQYPTLRVKINGHTDNIGKAKTNLKLSERRAKAIVNYLIEKGVDKDRLAFEGYGEYMPLVPNTTVEDRAKNRRVEIEIIN
jgi:outer membrane protein OmpA-like peptidoglycan-associated protein